jgi:SAM-dependent methyltransferase
MMRWQTKWLIDSAKGVLPFQKQLRRIKDRMVPYGSNPRFDEQTIRQGLRQVECINNVLPLRGAKVLEVGSGWQPMIPVLFSLAGASCVFLTDLNVLLRPASFDAALRSLRLHSELIKEALKLDTQRLDHALRVDPALSMQQRLAELRLVYLAPCDCRHLQLPANSVDVITSNACLEHVPPEVIKDIFRESNRLLRPGGVVCHIVDPSDHWEHQDKRLTRVNFLKYSDRVFRWTYINSLHYQNRLRHSEYLDILRQTGFRLVREEHEVDQPSLHALAHMPVATRFRRFSREDLATVESLLLGVK